MRVLFLPVGGQEVGSARLRVYQYLPNLASKGVVPRVVNVPDKSSKSAYACGLLRCFYHASRADLVFIQKRLFPVAVLRVLRRLSRIVYDFDDAVYLNDDCTPSPHQDRLAYLLRCSSLVIAGNDHLWRYARRYNTRVRILPTPAACTGGPGKEPSDEGTVVVGWIGTRGNLKYLSLLDGVFDRLSSRFGGKLCFRVVSDGRYEHQSLQVENIAWTREAELAELSRMDIGIMPLEDDPWTRGKCSFKALLYMSWGIPVVASRVGMNCQVIEHGKDGFLAADENAWLEDLSRLISQASLRKEVGRAARAKIREQYLFDDAAEKLHAYLEGVYGEH